MNPTIDPTRRGALDAAHDRQSEARAKREAAAAALDRARKLSVTANAKVADLESGSAATETEQAAALTAAIMAGHPSADLPAAADDAHASALASARLHASITGRALAALQTTHDKAVAEVKAAESAVIAAAKALVLSEGEAMAAEILHHEAEALRLRENLLGLRGSDIDRRAGEILRSAAIERVMVDTASAPRYLPGLALENGPHRARIAGFEQHWLRRIASLIEGDDPEAGDKAA
jgi:hypothetical protein